MAFPSAVTLGSLTFVVAAGVGLAAVASNASEDSAQRAATARGAATADHQQTAEPTGQPGDAQHEQEPKQKPRQQRPAAVPKVFVEVYNNSGITGLAATKAQVLERAGWNVAATDNWYGTIPDNTVYYPDKLRAPAHQLARLLHITRLRPAVSPMQFDRLTVIFTNLNR